MPNQFTDYHFKPFINLALADMGFVHTREVQAKVIPEIKAGRDLVVKAQTGSGKSHAFLLPLINAIQPDKDEVQVVITAPSRELADQLYQFSQDLIKPAGEAVRIENYVGGSNKEKQVQKLEQKQPHLAIGTPGRMLDMVSNHGLNIYTAQYLVVDEADMTLDLGFLREVDQLASRVGQSSQLLVFSATIPDKLKPFFKKYLNQPKFIYTESQSLIPDQVENWLIATKSKDRVDLIYDLLTLGQAYLALIFANTQDQVEAIAQALEERGLDCATLHGGLEARERKRVMRQIRNLDYQYVVATDLAARGIDIEGVSHVINAEIPNDLDYFIHRVGRTGRNGLPGLAVTFYGPDEIEAVQYLEDRGINFVAKTIKNHEVVDDKKHDHRQARKQVGKKKTYDPEIAGMVKKAKKKVKPNYKKKINRYKQRKNRRRK